MSDFDNRPTGEPGKDSIEELLRRSLQARAQDVEPDPRTWQKVSAGLERGRRLRLALAGVGAMAAVTMAAVVLPGMLNRTTVDLTPPATQGPDSVRTETEPAPGGSVACGGPEHVAAVFARDGEGLEGTIWAFCDDGSESMLDPQRPAGAVDTNPAMSWDGRSVVFERVAGGADPVLVHVDMTSGAAQTLMGGRLPAFSPDGRLAWVQPIDGGNDLILVGQPFGEPEMEFPVVDGTDGEWFDARRLAWDASGETLYAEIGYEGSVVQAYDVASGEGRRIETAEPAERYLGPGAAHQPGAVALVATCCAEFEGDRPGQAELRVLSGDEVERSVELPGGIDTQGPLWATWAPMGPLRSTADDVTVWSGGSRASYLVGDGHSVWVVEPDGNSRLITEAVTTAAANPALTSGEPVAGGAPSEQSQGAPRQDGLTDAAAEARDRIWRAAQARDFDLLRDAMGEEFTASFGGGGADEAIAMLRDMESRGEDPFGLILKLLAMPHAAQEREGGPSPIFTWPSVFAKTAEQWTAADEEQLRQLGTADEIEQWRRVGGYIGWRVGIDASGAWLYFVAGD